mmetsp:Transcript_4547/g.6702  ORF Transcript_4547/g.6702 Transcript_4547/m.6702 type:complete len:328 (+) Transcript_4547:224-1207(+)
MKIEDCFTDVRRLSTDKPLNELAVAKDILRLGRKVRIQQVPSSFYDKENDEKASELIEHAKKMYPNLVVAASHEITPFITDEHVNGIEFIDDLMDAEQIDVIYYLLAALNKHLNEDDNNNAMVTYEEFCELINTNDHVTLTTFLSETIGEDTAMVRALKSCHQTIIARLLHRLRDDKLMFKDVRGSWRILIRFSKTDDGQLTHLSTIHRRREQMYIKADDGFNFTHMYKFEWEVESHYSIKEGIVDNVEMRLLNTHFDKEDDEKRYGDHATYLHDVFKNAHENKEAPDMPIVEMPVEETPTPKRKKRKKKKVIEEEEPKKKDWCVIV